MQYSNLELKQNKLWLHHIKSALCTHILFKCFGITIFISLFFIAYFYVLNNPAYPTTVIPLTYLDQLIEFQPLALPVYLSLWVYIAIPPVLIIERQELYTFTLSIVLMSIVGLSVFYFWPTTIPASNIDWALYPSISFLKSVDATGNACPSMHVATAFFAGVWADYLYRRIKAPYWLRLINILWGVGIIYATIATRQHVAFDILGGILLASLAILLARSLFWQK